MDTTNAVTFALAVSSISMGVIVGTAVMGAYRFLKSIGIFRGHYYY